MSEQQQVIQEHILNIVWSFSWIQLPATRHSASFQHERMATEWLFSCDGQLILHDLHSAALVSRRPCAALPGGVSIIAPRVFALQSEKALLHIYHGRTEPPQKMVLPERLCALAASEHWVAGGTAKGRLYVWELASGALLCARDAHFQALRHLAFSPRESHLSTGGDDAVVHVWDLTKLLTVDAQNVRPQHTYREHSGAISSLLWGLGLRCYSSGLDNCVRVHQGTHLITTFCLPHKITALAVDSAERAIFVGCDNSTIHRLDLYTNDGAAAVGGRGRIVYVGDDTTVFHGPETLATCMALSFDGTTLVSGDDQGRIGLWNVATRELVKTIKQHKSAISHVQCCLKPEIESLPQLPLLKRVILPQEAQQHECFVMFKEHSYAVHETASSRIQRIRQLLNEDRHMNPEKLNQIQPPPEYNTLENELASVHKMYNDLKTLYDSLWKEHVELCTK